jgi:hypothetical protein
MKEYFERDLIIQPEFTLYFPNSKVVLVESNSVTGDRNVLCFDYNGKMKWQVPEPPNLHASNFFTSIYLTNGELYAYSKNGVEFHLDKETGIILGSQLIR